MALIDGVSPALAALVGVSPFFLSHLGMIPYETAFFVSVLLVMTELFSLGTFLGRIAKRNMVFHGLVTLLVGVVAFALIAVLAP